MKFDEFKKDVASNDTMRGVFAAISSSSQGGARENVNAALAEFVALKAAQKASDPSISTSEAIDATVKNVIGDSFYVVQQDRSQVLLPKAVGDTPISDKRIVAAFKGYLKPSALDRLEVRLPAGKDFGLSTPDVQKSDFYDLVDNTGKWVMDEFGGARLMVWNRFRGQYEYVLNKNNSPIRIDYLQEMKNPSKETIEAEKSIWQKLKEML